MKTEWLSSAAYAAAFLLTATSLAVAQPLQRGEGVIERERPEYDPAGVPMGGFRLFPSITGGVSYDDNIFRTDTSETSDVIWTISPALDLRSQWANHRLNLYANLDHLEYTDQDSESRTDWRAGGDGRLVIMRGSFIDVGGFYNSTHEDRGSPDLPGGAAEPAPYDNGHLEGSITYAPGRLGLSAGAEYDRYDYDSITIQPAAIVISNDDRDRDVFEVFGRASYEISPDYAIFGRLSYNWREFDDSLDRNGLHRDSDGYRVDGGVQFLATPLVRGELFAGYLQQEFSAPLDDVTGLNFGANVDWFATQLLTVHFTAERTVQDTVLAGASGRDDMAVGVAADYELLRNLILQGNLDYVFSDFRGIGREDDIFRAGLNARYLVNRTVWAEAGYRFAVRDSSFPGADYTNNILMLTVRLQM